ncbi:MAG: amidohydrolase family protein, partial [Deltaproteobacteria bacterium]|nr:amidohydrolase family protein [Deltaproteobacteria bacterium]
MELLSASFFLPMTNGTPLLKDSGLVMAKEKIIDVGTISELKKRYPQAEHHHFPGHCLMPGLVNAHCHLDLIDFYEQHYINADFAEPPQDFMETLVASIHYKQDAKTAQMIRGIERGIARLIETGTTCVGDVTCYEGSFKMLENAGLRGIVYPEILAGRGEQAQAKYEVALALMEKHLDGSHDRIRAGLAPYAPYLLSRNLLRIISQHAQHSAIPMQIHAAESFAEMEFFFDSQGPIATSLFPTMGWKELPPEQQKTPIQYLADIGFLEAPVTIVGGLHLSARDFPILARHLARVVYCPTVNKTMKHGSL